MVDTHNFGTKEDASVTGYLTPFWMTKDWKNRGKGQQNGQDARIIDITPFITEFPARFNGAGVAIRARDLQFLQRYFSGNPKRTINPKDVQILSSIFTNNSMQMSQQQKEFLQKFLNSVQ